MPINAAAAKTAADAVFMAICSEYIARHGSLPSNNDMKTHREACQQSLQYFTPAIDLGMSEDEAALARVFAERFNRQVRGMYHRLQSRHPSSGILIN